MKRVAIVHPWFPQYRKPFFDQLISRAAERGIEVAVFYGEAPPEWRARNDTVSAPYATALKSTFLRLGSRHLVWKHLRPLFRRGPWDLIIVEQAVRNLETYRLLTYSRRRLAFWGHGRTYTEHVSEFQEWVKARLTLLGGWFFAYTSGGAEAVTAIGFNPHRVTVVNNTIDATSLGESIDQLSDADIRSFQSAHGLHPSDFVGVFVGGLDESKRLSFLLEAADLIRSKQPHFHLIVAGDGSERGVVDSAAADRAWVHVVGNLFGRDKAMLLASGHIILMPGRVGLVAVDSFVAGTPVVTTRWDLHAPEFEYLRDEVNAVLADDSIEAFSDAVLALMVDPERLVRLSQGAHADRDAFTMDLMVTRFLAGLAGATAA